MKQYSSYKPSDVFWYNEIPTEWSISKNKFVLNEQKNIVDESWKDYKLLSLTKKGVIERDIENSKGKFPEFFNTYKIIKKNDLIFCLYDIQETPRTIGISENDGMITGSYNVFQTNQNPKFIYYWFLIIDDVKGLKPFYTGMRNVVRIETFMSLKIFLPPLQEQEQIVKYLDEKTTIIDKLISTKERKIELLKEQRTSLINEVITKGLNPNVKMKDSGVEWIGDIPESWGLISIKHLVSTKITDGPHETPTFVDNGVPFLSVESVQEGKLDFNKKRGYISEELNKIYSKKCLPKKDDVLIVKSGSTTGKSTIVETNEMFNIWSPLCIVRSNLNKIIPKFTFTSVQSNYFRKFIELGWSFGTQPNIGMGVIENLKLVVPSSIQEQQEIVEYLDKHTKEIDDLVSMEQKKIELLKEYRQSLISEVITGKIKVVE